MGQVNQIDFSITETERAMRCAVHGAYAGRFRTVNGREYGGRCPQCAEDEQAAAERAKRDEAAALRWSLTEVPAKFALAACAAFPPAVGRWLAAVEGRASSGPLVLVGDVGTGKTHIAVAALRVLVRAGLHGFYLSALDYGQRVRETWGAKREESERSLLRRYAQSAVLVLDEVGANRAAEESIVQDLIAARYDAGLMPRSIIVSNLAPAALDKAIGERAADRIREGATLVALTGESRRVPL